MSAANISKYKTTRSLVVPAGTRVVFISHQKQDIYRLAQALVNAGPEVQWEWLMDFDSALKAGLIEKIDDDHGP